MLVFLQERVLLPLIHREASSKEHLRIWSIGCRVGDEASTLALLVRSLLPAGWQERQITIFATDSDQAALARARDYHYPVHLLPELPDTVLPFLQAGPSTYRLHPSLRRQILFGSHLLLSQMPFPRLDLILCHDYCADYAPNQQRLLFNRLAYALTAEGYLWLASPALSDPDSVYYKRLEGEWPLYQRTSTPVDVPLLGWGRLKGQLGASLLSQDPLRQYDDLQEATMEELQATLEDREMAYEEVNHRFHELEQVYRDLEHVQRLKEDFLSMMSHEMRTPLTTLLLTTQSLQRRLVRAEQELVPESTTAFQKQFAKDLDTIEQMGLQISRHLTDLLDAAHLRNDMFYLSRSPMNLVKLVRQIIMQQEPVTARRIRLVSALEEMVGNWDEMRLEQMIGNLLTNALKYSDPSTEVVITLRYHFRTGRAQEVLIALQDQGPGIGEEDLPHIFDRFYRANKQHDDASASKSLGLGLYISAEIVKRHGGRIWVESGPGRGSTFFVALPLMEPEKGVLPDAAPELAMKEESVSKHS
jgi:signal transduction histidine kinase